MYLPSRYSHGECTSMHDDGIAYCFIHNLQSCIKSIRSTAVRNAVRYISGLATRNGHSHVQHYSPAPIALSRSNLQTDPWRLTYTSQVGTVW